MYVCMCPSDDSLFNFGSNTKVWSRSEVANLQAMRRVLCRVRDGGMYPNVPIRRCSHEPSAWHTLEVLWLGIYIYLMISVFEPAIFCYSP